MTDTNFLKAIKFEHPDVIPVTAGILPKAWFEYGDKLQKLIDKYPQFYHGVQVDPEQLRKNLSPSYRYGTWTDEWGCVWHNVEEGMEGIVTEHPINDEDEVFDLKIPDDRSGNRLPHGFMYLRLLDLCGFENGMIMFAEEDEHIQTLIDKVTEYNIYQVAALSRRAGDVVYFGDDLGMQNGLAIGAEKWRKYMKPAFRKIYGTMKSARPDVLIYMHTDGQIYEIMPDLVDCGVDMINPQFRANGIDNLVRVCRQENRIAINLDLDRQMFPFGSKGEIFDHVEEAVTSLYLPEGGLSLNVELNYETSLENMEYVLDAIEKWRHFKG